MNPLVLATHNAGKSREIAALLAPLGIVVVSADALGLPEPEETGATFAENAALKSEAAAGKSGKFALADDSGLCVAALEGAPGIHSARWAGAKKDFAGAMERIRQELVKKRTDPVGADAYFVCVLALSSPEGGTETFEGRVGGHLTFPPRGERGFGYDPLFVPRGYKETFGEIEPEEKHRISHRAQAFARFVEFLNRCRAEAG